MLRRKHIKAPASFDPGKGRPREHLAYLNKAEMELLRVLTDGVVERGPKGLPSFAVTTGKTTTKTSGPSSGPGGGSLHASVRTAPSSGIGGGGASSGRSSVGGSQSKAPAGGSMGGVGSKGSTAAKSAPAATKAPAGGSMGGIGSKGTTAARAAPAAPKAAPAAAPRSLSGIGSPGARTPPVAPSVAPSRPPVGGSMGGVGTRGSTATKNAPAPAAAVKTPAALSPSQSNAYKTFGQKMAAAPRQPEVARAPGDAERMARMAMAESGIIRDETGKMNPVGAQAIMSVIRNRMLDQDQTVGGVISQRAQFSPWGDGKYSKVKPSPSYTALAEQVLRGNVPDVTKGADTYHNRATVLGGFSTAGAATKDRVRNNFKETFGIRDNKLPGTYGHEFGVAADGSKAVSRKPAPQKVLRGGIADAADPARPVALPPGALSRDPNVGGMGLGAEVRSVPGRFGGAIPVKTQRGDVERISTDGPIDTKGALSATATVPMTFKKDPFRVSTPSAEGLSPKAVNAWQQTLNAFGKEVPIVSAYRDPKINAKAGGAKKSRHMQGDAIDVDVRNLSVPERQQLIREARRSGFTGIGVYGNSLHFDMGKARSWGPDRSARTTPGWAKAAISGKVEPRVAAPAAPAAPGGGVLNTVARAGQVGKDIMSGKYVVPGNQIRAGLGNPMIGRYAQAQSLPGFVRAGIDGAAGKAIGPAMRDGFARALSTAQGFVTPRERPASVPAAIGRSGVGYPNAPGGGPAAPAAAPAPSPSGMYRGGGEGSRNPYEFIQRPYYAAPAAPPPSAMAPAPAQVPAGPNRFEDVMTTEEVLRRLLGEEWYA